MYNKQNAGEKRKELRKRALKLAREAKAARKAAGILHEARYVALELQKEADLLKAEAESHKEQARREDLSLEAGEVKENEEWQAALLLLDGHLEGEKPYPEFASGSCAKMDAEGALQNARQEKARSLGIRAN